MKYIGLYLTGRNAKLCKWVEKIKVIKRRGSSTLEKDLDVFVNHKLNIGQQCETTVDKTNTISGSINGKHRF